jgi:hypothetical protein
MCVYIGGKILKLILKNCAWVGLILVQNRFQLQDVMNTVVTHGIQYNAGSAWTAPAF